MDHRKPCFQIRPGRGRDRRAALGKAARLLLQFGRTQVSSRHVDEIADKRGRFGEQRQFLDASRLVAQQDSRAFRRNRLGLVAIEPILAEHPAQRRAARA
jgi:hypothetical protein